jgi:hypothetical protein
MSAVIRFRTIQPMLDVLGKQYLTHKKEHDTRIRFEYCRTDGCLEMRRSARHAYELYAASGMSSNGESEFRLAMVNIYRNESGPDENMSFPRPRVLTS